MKDFSDVDGKIITEEDARLYRTTSILAILDSPYFDYSNTNFSLKNPTLIKDSTKVKIGFASVFIHNNKIIAKSVFDYHTPDRLDIEIKNGIYLIANGFMVMEESNLSAIDFYGHPKKVQEILISSLSLTHKRPSDHRIEPLGQPVLI